MTRQAETKMQYRVYEANGTRCIRKFDSIDEAQEWCWTVDTGKSYRIEFQYDGEEAPRRVYM